MRSNELGGEVLSAEGIRQWVVVGALCSDRLSVHAVVETLDSRGDAGRPRWRAVYRSRMCSAAEDQLKIQSAQIGIAEAEMLPHIGINGSVGLAADSLGRLFNSQSWTGSIGPSLTWNILNYGRLLAALRFQNALFQQYVATYQQAVLNANQDAENAIVGYLKTQEQAEHLQSSADAASKLTGYLIKQQQTGYLPPEPPNQRVHQPALHRHQFPGHAAG